jgi:predicted Zn finger-like uncharacterized protein
VSTIIQCPNCNTKYRLKFVIEDGRQVRCPGCQTVWRYQAEAPAEAEAAPETPPQQAGLHQGFRTQTASASAYDQTAYSHGYHTAESHDSEPAQTSSGYADAADNDWQSAVDDRAAALSQFVRSSEMAASAPSYAAPEPKPGGWAADLANAIDKAGYEPKTTYEGEAQQDRAREEFDGAALSADQQAAEQLSAFWRGERAAASLDDELDYTMRDQMPVKQLEEAALPRGRGGLAVAAAWGVYVAFMSGALTSAVFFRDGVVAAMPGAATYYKALGLKVTAEPLKFEDVVYSWSKRGERPVLEVRGNVANLTNVSVRVPPLHISVRDDQSAEIAKTVAHVVKEPLAAGAKTAFTLEFLSPPRSIAGVELQFGG